jgi:trehalose 6-phosphate phosphatase
MRFLLRLLFGSKRDFRWPICQPDPASRVVGAAANGNGYEMNETKPLLDPNRHALLLDFDGTLVDFAPRPDAVEPRSETVGVLRGLAERFGGALGIISGRRIADIDGFLRPLSLPASGVHGQELRPASGEMRRREPSQHVDEARGRLRDALGPDDPLRLEDKGGALVLHFREHPDQEERARSLARDAADGLNDLVVVEGHAIAEIRQRGVDKAGAIRDLMRTPPFKGRLPVFVGDDVTDEDGFRAAAELGGFGVKVGAGETSAAFRLPDVEAVHRWLATLL